MERTAITGPLLQFQSTLLETDDVRKLVKSLNAALGEQALDEGRVDEIFNVWWPKLEETLESIGEEEPEEKPKARQQGDLLAEILDLVRSQQQLLTQPEELLPPRYLEFVLSEQGHGRQPHPMAMRDLRKNWRILTQGLEKRKIAKGLREEIERLGPPIEYLLSEFDTHRRLDRKSKDLLD